MKLKQLFTLGSIKATLQAVELIQANDMEIMDLVMFHAIGQWGNVCANDSQENDKAVKHGGRILSSYDLPDGAALWVITQADRSGTTILCPSEC